MTSPFTLNKASMGIGEGLPLNACGDSLEDLRKGIQHLMDIEAIKQLKHAYFRCLDTGNFEELETLLHTDLKVHYTGGDYDIELNSRQEFVGAMRHAFNADAVTRHNGMHPEIQILSETEATGIWYLYDHFWSLPQQRLTQGTALYWDHYQKIDNRWVISDTRYKRLYQINEDLEQTPNFVSHYLGEQK
ncbi:nuclear transport factor 2 family protein [Aestuariicella hydrocarbonica]|uniref:Nuclear transport factor 2 family protein n=1 Tax=Pseudomaricurvus hydrocarbonicus TaxID=1470433 RepID=A0A9E5MI60_9GAMM|nr:nuclear transport factor 2 family protein [Aestuariicella hydrocarbonica]NHO66891.1 nuclear transport factor 2 family protein [Aestuariicella hydrocarbonica]